MKSNKQILIFDPVICTEGLPCHKFILKSLTTINDAKVFTKNYVATMKAAGMNDSDIESSLLFFSGIARELEGRYDFSSWDKHIEGFSLINDILFDNDVAMFKTCRQYYKKLDSKYTACVLCPLSANYKNANMEAEKNIVLFALSSHENLDYVLSKGITADNFISVTDITSRKAVSLKPCIYPFYKNTMAALTDPSIRDDVYMFENDYDPVLEKYHSKKIGRMSSIEKDCSFSVNTFCAVMISDMLSGTPCSRTEVDTYIKMLLPEPNSSLTSLYDEGISVLDDVISLNTSCNLGADAFPDFYTSSRKKRGRKAKSNTTASTQKISDAKEAEQKSAFVSVTLDSILSSMANQVPDEETASMSGAKDVQKDSATANTAALSDTQCQHDLPTEPEKLQDNFTPISACAENDTSIHEEGAAASAALPATYIPFGNNYPDNRRLIHTCTDSSSPRITITEILTSDELYTPQEDDMVGIPTITMDELQHFALDLDCGSSLLLSLFESHIYKDKRLALEIVCVSATDFYLLLYSPKLHKYFYTKCSSSAVNEILSPLLSHRSIEKFCYYPYILVSVLRKMNMHVRNLYSLFSMSRMCLGNHTLTMDMALREMGAQKAIGGVTVQAEGDIHSVALLYMHCYHNVFYRTKRRLLKSGFWNEYETSNIYDIVLGLSYHQNIFSTADEYLFKLKHANGYLFRNKGSLQFKYPGKRICFRLRHIPKQKPTLMINLLCEMYDKGLFVKTDIMLLSMNQFFFSLYVMEQDVEYVETRINRILLSLLHHEQIKGVEYHMAELTGADLYIE